MLLCSFAKNWEQARCVATSLRPDAKPTLASKKFKSRPLLAKLDADGKVSEIYVKSKGPSLAQRLSGDYAKKKRLGRDAAVEMLTDKFGRFAVLRPIMTEDSRRSLDKIKVAIGHLDGGRIDGQTFAKIFGTCESFQPNYSDERWRWPRDLGKVRKKLETISVGKQYMTPESKTALAELKISLTAADERKMNREALEKLSRACDSFKPRFMEAEAVKSIDDLLSFAQMSCLS